MFSIYFLNESGGKCYLRPNNLRKDKFDLAKFFEMTTFDYRSTWLIFMAQDKGAGLLMIREKNEFLDSQWNKDIR
jgi:hypothetical protein